MSRGRRCHAKSAAKAFQVPRFKFHVGGRERETWNLKPETVRGPPKALKIKNPPSPIDFLGPNSVRFRLFEQQGEAGIRRRRLFRTAL
jgi:hypothetical protein